MYSSALCSAVVAAVVLVINLIFTIWAVSRFEVQDGLGILQDGSYRKTMTFIFWIHLTINVPSILLLGASSYTMQYLSSPIRSEIDEAYDQGIWLAIGVPSVRLCEGFPQSELPFGGCLLNIPYLHMYCTTVQSSRVCSPISIICSWCRASS